MYMFMFTRQDFLKITFLSAKTVFDLELKQFLVQDELYIYIYFLLWKVFYFVEYIDFTK
jgi:hypothetical protein